MRTGFKVGLMVLVVVVCAIVLLSAYGWYALHNPDRYIPDAVAYLQQKTGDQVQIRHIEVRWSPRLLVRFYGLEIKNPKPFPAGDFLKAPEVDAAVEVGPLLHQKIAIRSLVLDHPFIDFISDPDGLWNFQNPASSKQKPARFSMGVISSLQIKNGLLLGSNLIDPADTPGPVVLVVHNFSAELRQIDVQAVARTGSPHAIEGSLEADAARFGSIHTTNLHSKLRITSKQLTFKDFDAKTHSGQASGDFSLIFAGKKTNFDTALRVSGIGMPYLLAEFQPGPPKMTGTMDANLKLAGEIEHTSNPLAGIHGTGHITIRKGELPNLNKNKNMIQMKRFRDPGTAALPPAAFSTFVGDMDLRNHRIYSKQVGVNFYGINVDGSGSTSVMGTGGMDYRGMATVMTKQGFFTDMFASWFKGAKIKNGRMNFPIRVTGTLANPQCSIVH